VLDGGAVWPAQLPDGDDEPALKTNTVWVADVATFAGFRGSLQTTLNEALPGWRPTGNAIVLIAVPVALATAGAEVICAPAGGASKATQEKPGRVMLVTLTGLPAVAGVVTPIMETVLAGVTVKSAESLNVPAFGTTQETDPFAVPLTAVSGIVTATLAEAGTVALPPLTLAV
jgi:hypothetical protein